MVGLFDIQTGRRQQVREADHRIQRRAQLVRHFGQEGLARLGHGGLLLGRRAGVLGLDPRGHVAFVQQHAHLAGRRIRDRPHVELMPAQPVTRDDLADVGDGVSGQGGGQQRRRALRLGEPRLEPVGRRAVGGEGRRIGEDRPPLGIEQADQGRGMAQGLGRAVLVAVRRDGRSLDQQHRRPVFQKIGRDHRRHRHRVAVGVEGPLVADDRPVGGLARQPFDARHGRRRQLAEATGQQGLQTVRLP